MSDYRTLDDLMKEEVTSVYEHDGFYYVKLKPRAYYENTIWKVDKKTGKATYMMFTDFICHVLEFAKQIDPETLKRAS